MDIEGRLPDYLIACVGSGSMRPVFLSIYY